MKPNKQRDAERAQERFAEEHPSAVSWRRARWWAGKLWTEQGPCRCATPHPRPDADCADLDLMNRVERGLQFHGLGGRLLGLLMVPPGGRRKGTTGIPQRNRRRVAPLSPKEREALQFLEERLSEANHSGVPAELRQRMARRETRESLGVSVQDLRSIISRGERRTRER